MATAQTDRLSVSESTQQFIVRIEREIELTHVPGEPLVIGRAPRADTAEIAFELRRFIQQIGPVEFAIA